MSKTVKCPTCGGPAEWSPDNTARPFCSTRCKLLDLGDWFTESHRIPGPELDDEAVTQLEHLSDQPANEDGGY